MRLLALTAAFAPGCGEKASNTPTDLLLHDPGDPNFARSIASLGDLDGDGIPDLAVGSPGLDAGGADRGVVFVVFLNADGTRKAQTKIGFGQDGFGGPLRDHDFFGFAVAPVGDLDGDGVVDIACGAPGDNNESESQGAVWVLFLKTDGTVKSQQVVGSEMGGLTALLDAEDQFGSSVSALGDLDSDGVPDLAAGAPLDDDGGPDQGAVWILFLNAGGTVKAQQKISVLEGGFTGSLHPNDHFGSSIASPGDLDSDGVPDLAVGAPLDDDGSALRGAVWILFLNTNGTVKAFQKISSVAGGFPGPLTSRDEFGSSLGALGDRDGDGIPDLVAGAPGERGHAEVGAVWVLNLDTNGTVKTQLQIGRGLGGFKGDLESLDRFGGSVGGIPDVDGDGVRDLAVGAPGDGPRGGARGALWILLLNPDGTVKGQKKTQFKN